MKRFILNLLCGVAFCAPLIASDQKQSYFDTKFLAQPDLVKQQLITEGFTEGFFTASDGIRLDYLWLARPQARCTVICSSGFWPGRKEGMATLYELLPADCNILFFDARGHGVSEGSLWRNLLQYGAHEYKDIEGAVAWAHKQSGKPIVLFGVCAGAFHATHAVYHMQKKQVIEQYNIQGLIFDSGWSSLTSIVPTALSGELKKRMMKCVKVWPMVAQRGIRWTVVSPLSFLIRITTPSLTWLCVSKKAHEANLLSKIDDVLIPILYMHSEDDSFAPIEPVKQLAARTKQTHTWWITEPSTHACHHIKHAQTYREKLKQFIDAVV